MIEILGGCVVVVAIWGISGSLLVAMWVTVREIRRRK